MDVFVFKGYFNITFVMSKSAETILQGFFLLLYRAF